MPATIANGFGFIPRHVCLLKCYNDRSVYFTEGVLKALKDGKVKGPYCDVLLTPTDLAKMEEKQKQGINWRPPGATVYLSGK